MSQPQSDIDDGAVITDVYDKVNETLYAHYGIKFSVNAETQTRAFFKSLCEEFGGDEVIESWDIACEQYPDPVTALTKLKGILYNRRRFYSFIEKN